MAIRAEKDKVVIEVSLDYSPQQEQRIAQRVANFQRSQQEAQKRHKQKLEQQNEAHLQRLKQMEERANKQAELRAKRSQERILKGTRTWSEKMLSSINSIRGAVIAMGVAFVSTQVIGGIKQLATESLSLASDVNTLAKALGLTVEDLSRLRGIAEVTGTSMGTLQASFSAVTARLEDARRGAVEAQRAFEALGIDFETADLRVVVEALFNASGNAENLGKVAKIAGQEASTAFARLAQFSDNFSSAMELASQKFGELETGGAEALNTLADRIAEIRLQTQFSITNAIGGVAPELQASLERIGTALESVDWGRLAVNLALLTEAMVKLAGVGPKLSQSLSSVLTFFIGLNSIFSAGTFGQLFTDFIYSQINPLTKSLSKLGLFVLNIAQKIRNFQYRLGLFVKYTPGLQKLVNTFKFLGGALKTLLKPLASVAKVLGRWSLLLSAFFVVWDLFKARMSGLGWLESAWFTIRSFFYSIADLITLFQFDLMGKLDRELEKARAIKSAREDFVGPMIPEAILAERVKKTKEELEKVVDPLKSYTDKINDLREKQAQQNAEFATWLDLLQRGAIDLREFNSLTKDLQNQPNAFKALGAGNVNAPVGDAPVRGGGAVAPTLVSTPEKLVPKKKALNEEWSKEAQLIVDVTNKLGYYYVKMVEVFDGSNGFFNQLGQITGSLTQTYDYLIQAEQYRLEAQREANREKLEMLSEELQMLDRLGLSNTTFYKRKKKESEDLEDVESARLRRLQEQRKKFAIADALINSFASFTKNIATYAWPLGAVLGGLSLAAGLAQVQAISAQQFATGGIIPGNPYQDSTQIYAQGGEYIVNRNATARNLNLLESINNGGSFGGGGGSITLNVQGNIIGEDSWVRDNLLPQINRAVREGHELAYTS